MLTDSWTNRSTPAWIAASTRAAEPSVRTRLLSRQARLSMNFVIGGIADVRLTTAVWPAIASARPVRSKIDTRTGSAPCPLSLASLSGDRAITLGLCPAAINAGIA